MYAQCKHCANQYGPRCTENFVLFDRRISAFNQGKFFCKKLAHLWDVQSDRNNTNYTKNI